DLPMSFLNSYTSRSCHHSLPTRRSSDLSREEHLGFLAEFLRGVGSFCQVLLGQFFEAFASINRHVDGGHSGDERRPQRTGPAERSEEHTSELQSPYDIVCRLLLEKKKQK